MNAQEQQLIDELVDRIRNTPAQNKDTDAEQRLQQGLSNVPDAVYILAQTVIVQKYGLEQAQGRMQSMQSELDTLRQQVAQAVAHPSGGSFLSHIFGSAPAQPAQSSPVTSPQGGWQPVSNSGFPQTGGVPAQANYPPAGYGYGQPGFGNGGFGGGGGGFLQGALQTAAGVAMGEMAVQSMESLFHGFGGGGGYGGRGFEDGRPSETIVNNYNDDEPHHGDADSSRDRDDSRFYNPQDDASRDSDQGSKFADSGNDTDSGDGNDAGSDDADYDSADDSSNFDSGGDGGSDGDNGNY